MIAFSCPSCRTQLERTDHEAGTKFACPNCGQRLQVPRAPEPTDHTVMGELRWVSVNESPRQPVSPSIQPAKIRCVCPHCQAVIKAPAKAGGTRRSCPRCSLLFEIPVPRATPVDAPVEQPSVRGEQTAVRDVSGNNNVHSPQEFLDFLVQHGNPTPLLQFPARACLADPGVPYALQYPAGEVVVYPGFVVFLTTIIARPGLGVAVNAVVEQLNKQQAMNADPWAKLAYAAHKLVGELNSEAKLREALASPNSLYVPFRLVKGVGHLPGSFWRSHRITLELPSSQFLICQDPFQSDAQSWRSEKWQEEFIQLMRELGQERKP